MESTVFASRNAKSKLLFPTISTTLNLLGSFIEQGQTSHMKSLHVAISEMSYFSRGAPFVFRFRERLQCELVPQAHQKVLI